MTKQLSIAAMLVFAVACKTDPPSQPSSSETARSAKIEVKSVQTPTPALPEEPAAPVPQRPATAPPPDPAAIAEEGPKDYPVAQTEVPASANPPRPDEDEPRGRQVWRKRRRLDTNHDGKVTPDEVAAFSNARMDAAHARFDADGDGKLTPEEFGAAGGRLKFDNPAALDTNRDGDISSAEIAAGLKARREAQGRQARPAPPPPEDGTTPQ